MRCHEVIFNSKNPWYCSQPPNNLGRVWGWLSNCFSHGQTEIKTTPSAHFALQAQASTLQFHEALGDGQAQSSTLRALAGFAQTVKSFENTFLFFRRDPRAVVAHPYLNLAVELP